MKIETTIGMVVVIALIFSLGAYTLSNIQSTQTINSAEYNVTGQGITAFSSFATLLTPIIYIVLTATIFWAIYLLVSSSKKIV